MRPELREIPLEPYGPDVIRRLEQVIEQARRGELSSIAFAAVYRNGNTGSGFSDLANIDLMLAAVARLQQRLLKLAE